MDLNAQKEEMRELDLMNWTDSTLAKEDRTVETRVLVEDSVLDVEGEQILDLDGSSKSKGGPRVSPESAERGQRRRQKRRQKESKDRTTHLDSESPSSKTDEAWKRKGASRES